MVLLLLVSCSTDEKSYDVSGVAYATTPVSGKVFGRDFTAGGGYARYVIANGTSAYNIYLTASATDCSGTSDRPVWIIAPAYLGE